MTPPGNAARAHEAKDLGLRPVRGVLLWRLHDGSSLLEGHIAQCGALGVEYRLFHDGRFAYSERFVTRAEAIDALSVRRTEYLAGGWRQVYPQRRPEFSATT